MCVPGVLLRWIFAWGIHARSSVPFWCHRQYSCMQPPTQTRGRVSPLCGYGRFELRTLVWSSSWASGSDHGDMVHFVVGSFVVVSWISSLLHVSPCLMWDCTFPASQVSSVAAGSPEQGSNWELQPWSTMLGGCGSSLRKNAYVVRYWDNSIEYCVVLRGRMMESVSLRATSPRCFATATWNAV